MFRSLRAWRTESAATAWSRVAVALCAAWLVVHLAFYVRLIRPSATLFFEHAHANGFFVWQLAGFLVLVVLLAIVRPAIAGRAALAYLAVSTLVLLGISRDPVRIVGLPALLAWSLCAANTTRLALRRWVGEEFATWAVAAGCIYAALIPICFLLGLAHCLRFWPVAATAVLLALPGAVELRRELPGVWRAMAEGFSRLDIVEIAILESLWMLLALAMVNASVDEVWSDAVRVHLPYAHQTAMDQGLSYQDACPYRLQAMAVQTCFAAFYILGSDLLVKWACWLSVVSLALLVAEEVRRRGGSRGLTLFGAAATLGCPLLLWLAATAYIDQIMTLLCSTALMVLLRALRPPSLRGILCSALLMSSAAQAKYTGLIFGVAWGLVLAVGLLRQMPWRRAVQWCLAGGGLAALASLPWYAWVYLGTGNPFYPFFDRWFHSPFWSDERDLLASINQHFHFHPGILSRLVFPWTATFHSTQVVEGYDGILGFWGVALLPCLLLTWWWRERKGWDSALTGTLMIGGILLFTPYARYWLPGYPLLMVGLVLAMGAVLRRGVGDAGRMVRVPLGIVLLFVLLLPLPFWLSGDAWAAYRMPGKRDGWLSWRFPGYPAIAQLNQIVEPEEGVLSSGYLGVHKINARAYHYQHKYDPVLKIRDRASFDDFCRRHRIRYWVVDQGNVAIRQDFAHLDPERYYWTADRTVFASGTVVVYDLQHSRHCPWREVALKEIPASVADAAQPPPADGVPSSGWSADASSRVEEREVVVGSGGRIKHAFTPPAGATHCEVQLDLDRAGGSTAFAEIVWFDVQSKAFQSVPGFLVAKGADFHAGFHATFPPRVTDAYFSLSPQGAEPLRVRRAVLKFSTDQPASSDVPVGHIAEVLP